MFFNTKKIEPIEKDSSLNKDLAIITNEPRVCNIFGLK